MCQLKIDPMPMFISLVVLPEVFCVWRGDVRLKMRRFIPIEFVRVLSASGNLAVPSPPDFMEAPTVGFV